MSDSRRRHRPDSRQMWDESDRRDRRRDRDRDRDRGGDRRDRDRDAPDRRDRDRDDRRNYRSRSRSRDRRPRDRDRDFDRPRDRGPRDRDTDRGRRDDRRRDDGARSIPDRTDHRPRRSASPPARRASPPPKKPISFNVGHGTASPPANSPPAKADPPADGSDEEPVVEEEMDPDMAAMQAMMGFGSFGSTKGKKVAGNNVGAVHKEKKTEYRQYMNRQGGFNRPLSPSR